MDFTELFGSWINGFPSSDLGLLQCIQKPRYSLRMSIIENFEKKIIIVEEQILITWELNHSYIATSFDLSIYFYFLLVLHAYC